MKEFLSSLSQQSPAAGSQEGLPFGIFWFLVSVIILLIFFIFLRDKELRRRINLFFFGTKQKLIKIRLQGRLKRERKKKSSLLQNMGKTVWEHKINLAGISPYFEVLNNLEKERTLKVQKIADIDAQILSLNKYDRTYFYDISRFQIPGAIDTPSSPFSRTDKKPGCTQHDISNYC